MLLYILAQDPLRFILAFAAARVDFAHLLQFDKTSGSVQHGVFDVFVRDACTRSPPALRALTRLKRDRS